ncbi:hypothetical protein F4805DRAFT_425061 [Annulohypoxylon moriforme]|nr:hypothetical protein F4805DRAFT_425061 [Annulohypoxylon moriforme]
MLSTKDYNHLSIEPPKTKKKATWETVKHGLHEFLALDPAPHMQLAHVEGPPGSGKSTGMLAFIWDEIQSLNPETRVIYVPSFFAEGRMLHAYFNSRASPHEKLKNKTRIGGTHSIESKLHIRTIAGLRLALREDALHNYEALPRSVTLILDLEPEPTAIGEILLSELALWSFLRQTRTPALRGAELRVITMAAFSRPLVHNLLAWHPDTTCHHFTITPIMHDGSITPKSLEESDLPLKISWQLEAQAGCPEWLEQLIHRTFHGVERSEEMNALEDLMISYISKVPENTRWEAKAERDIKTLNLPFVIVGGTETEMAGPAIVILSGDKEPDIRGKYDPKTVRAYRIIEPTDWLAAMIDIGPKIIFISSTIPIVLHIPKITAIVYYGISNREAFDVSNSHINSQCCPMSRMDILKAQSYALKTSADAPETVDFYCTSPHRDNSKPPIKFEEMPLVSDSSAYGRQLLHLSLEICAPWPLQGLAPDIRPSRLPLPPTLDVDRIREIWRRLAKMDCLQLAANGPFPDDIAVRPRLETPRARGTLNALYSRFCPLSRSSCKVFRISSRRKRSG